MDAVIYVVEDDPDFQRLLVAILMDAGYGVKAVDNGVEALALLYQSSRPPSLILLDLMMPYMDGPSFLRAQRDDIDIASIPVVLISSVDNLPGWANDLNVVDYLPKPFEIDWLLDCVARYCT